MQVKTPKLVVPHSGKLSIGIVVAMGLDRAIGQKGTMPWYVPEDLKHFKQQTLNSCVIMGRRTFESIGRPLPSRRNIVVTRDLSLAVNHRVEVAASLEAALELAQDSSAEEASACAHGVDLKLAERLEYSTCFVIGGARLFEEALSVADQVVITKLRCRFPEADVFFPQMPSGFKLSQRSPEEPAYFHSVAEQPEGFAQYIPAEQVKLLSREGAIVTEPLGAGLDYCFETYVKA